MKRIGTKLGPRMLGAKRLPESVWLTVSPTSRVVSEGGSSVIAGVSANWTRSTTATVAHEAIVQAFGRRESDLAGLVLSSSNPDVGTVAQNGQVTRVTNGTIRVIAQTAAGLRVLSPVIELSESSGQTQDTFLSWIAGSLARYQADLIDSAIATGDPAVMKPMYTSGYTRNPACWPALHTDLSCIDWEKPGSCLIGWQYGLQAEHYADGADTRVATDGEVATRNVIARINIGPPNSEDRYATDISVVKYASPFPAKFVPALLPPSNLLDYFDQTLMSTSLYRVPMLWKNQKGNATVGDMNGFHNHITPIHPTTSSTVPVDERRLAFYETKIPGDSGSPGFWFVPHEGTGFTDRLMLISLLTYGGAGRGPGIWAWVNDIIAAIVAMGGSAEDVTIADLTSYLTFGA
jgi:hypothetical protein